MYGAVLALEKDEKTNESNARGDSNRKGRTKGE